MSLLWTRFWAMNELGPKDMDLLARIAEKPELRPMFFRRVSGLKWFDALSTAGYFACRNIPPPRPASETGYVTIPRWEIADYLVKTAPELAQRVDAEVASRFVAVIVEATAFAKENGFSNYQTWWSFAKAI